MRSLSPFRILSGAALTLALCVTALGADAGEVAKLLPDRVGDATSQGATRTPAGGLFEQIKPEEFGPASSAVRAYILPGGGKVTVQLIKTSSASAAFALFSTLAKQPPFDQTANAVGPAAVATNDRVIFRKGVVLAIVEGAGQGDSLLNFARALSQAVEAEDGEIPPLVLHLPDGEPARSGRALYAVTMSALRQAVPNQPALDAASFDGGTEAVAADYGAAGRLVVVEYATPQIAAESDARVSQRIAELRGAGQSVPAVYRRVGNYSVFVFDAADAAAAERLAGQVRYEKDVRWLGDDPHRFERHNRAWINMSASVLVNTFKAAGLAIMLCLGGGIVFGAVIFRRRRAQAAFAQSYSDAGGMLSLDLDEHAAKLLGRGDK